MVLIKSQILNFLNDKLLFRFSISNDFIINFNENEAIFTFDELERIINSNFTYWSSINDIAPNNFMSNWQDLKHKFNVINKYLFELEELNIDDINYQIYNNLSSDREYGEQDKTIYKLSIASPIDRDSEIRIIKSFVSFYTQQNQNNLVEAIKSYIYLSKNPSYIGSYFSNSYEYKFYPALFLLRKNFSNIKENLSDFETNIVAPITNKLRDISIQSDKQYREITSFTEDKHNEIQKQFDKKVSEFTEFQKSLNEWQEEKQNKLNDLQETYKNKLSLEAPEQLWNERAVEHQKRATRWTYFLIGAALALISALVLLVIVIHDYSLNIIKKDLPFISESFILISVISFFIYIIRVLIKIVMSNHHLATEYKQKAALTRFYQALTYAGTDIDKEERLIIIHSLFSRVETGLVKIDASNDSDAILALLSKNLK
ncbi:DUF6161 domain-containing protein [Streptococcus parasanguinis]|uniref:DUF6161 domain-containing protein n=1 Tax=Streptococcus parasanguinis TaxID=1318 RepID=A0A6L6LDI7_STRPA|nr:DUF6161 domain-containing protein [Streptococcus parasanguinis]MTR61830.1 hypothetical protein [Streptococcus parasanguinis]MTR64230.1 hypothetical protein [Streptococcus parasanguinis]MTR68848.1 hypothetical protein [Streptococcus parasanguinis]MTS04743.1 hypothetical protein [Streptococcus parasanguinis]